MHHIYFVTYWDNSGANREEDYLKKNPTGRVPSIEDGDGSYLFER